MRNYPSVPNVFRVISSQSVNNEDNYKLPVNCGGNVSVAAAANGAVEMGVKVGNGSGSSAALIEENKVNVQRNGATAKHQQRTAPYNQQLQQQQQQAALQYAKTTAETYSKPDTVQPRLSKTASMERNCTNPNAMYREAYSPYGTLPRFLPGISNGDLSDLTANNTKQQQQPLRTQDNAMAGLINTISGSISSTGVKNNGTVTFEADTKRHSLHNNAAARGQPQAQAQQQPQGGGKIVNYYQGRQKYSSRDERANNGYLWILTPVAASISVAIVIAALAGPQWLFTEEKLPNSNYNGTANFNVLDDGAFITKYTKSSLWILCTTLQGVETYNCIKIDYFPKEGYQPDPHDSTPAIPYTITKSSPFFLAAGCFLVLSFIVFLIPTCSQQNSLYYFTAGIMFIVSGLLMLIGLIAYISILKAEIGSKLRPKSPLQPPFFKVTYGQSFFLFVFGFVATEFVGLLNIFLYISLQEVGYYNHLPCFTITSLQEKIKEGSGAQNTRYKSYRPLNLVPCGNGSTVPIHNNSRQQVFDAQLAGSSFKPTELFSISGKPMLQQLPEYPCRKHSTTLASNLRPEDNMERRYYFEKPPFMSKCNLHAKNLAKSLNELYTEPTLPMAVPPPPSAIKASAPHTLPRLQQSNINIYGDHLSQNFPLTRSVSTTTDIYTNEGMRNGNNSRSITPYLERKNRRNMATETHFGGFESLDSRTSQNVPARTHANDVLSSYDAEEEEQQKLCGLRRSLRKSKDELFHEFCKRAGVRPKPKNIYYIADEEEHLAEQLKRQREEGMAMETSTQRNLNANGNPVRRNEKEHQNLAQADGREHLVLEADDQLCVIDDNSTYLLPNPMRNMRRASMYAEPLHLRTLNSDLSSQTVYPPPERTHQMSLFDLDKLSEDYGSVPANDYHRTLPRAYVRRSTDSLDSMGSASLQVSTHALQNAYSDSQKRLTHLMLQHQQQQQQYQQQKQQQLLQQSRLLSVSREAGLYHSATALNNMPEAAVPQNKQAANITFNGGHNNTPQSTSATTVQWPTAIPSSPANLPPKYQLYATNPNAHNLLSRSTSGGGVGCTNGAAMNLAKFQRGYAFDVDRNSGSVIMETFDLDEMERERRRSHASLFSGSSRSGIIGANSSFERYDLMNGTAV